MIDVYFFKIDLLVQCGEGSEPTRFEIFGDFWHIFEQIICYCETIYQSISKILFVSCAKWSYLYGGTNFMILRCWKPEIWRHFMIFGVFSEILAYFRTDNLLLWSHLSIDYQNSFCIVCRIVLPLRWYQLYDSTMLETLDITSFHDFRRINCDILVFAMLWRHLWRHHNFFLFFIFLYTKTFP